MKPHALIFDMDGTIVDNMPYHTQTWLELLARRGVPTTAEAFFHDTAGMTNPQIVRHYFGADSSDALIAEISVEKEAIYRELYGPHVKPHTGLVDLLTSARAQGIRTGLATSAPQENIDFILDGASLRALFDTVVGHADITHGKPHPEIYLVTAERLGVDPSRCVAFEDAPIGIESAVRAGMRTYVMTTVLSREDALRQPGVAGAFPDFTEAAREILR